MNCFWFTGLTTTTRKYRRDEKLRDLGLFGGHIRSGSHALANERLLLCTRPSSGPVLQCGIWWVLNRMNHDSNLQFNWPAVLCLFRWGLVIIARVARKYMKSRDEIGYKINIKKEYKVSEELRDREESDLMLYKMV